MKLVGLLKLRDLKQEAYSYIQFQLALLSCFVTESKLVLLATGQATK